MDILVIERDVDIIEFEFDSMRYLIDAENLLASHPDIKEWHVNDDGYGEFESHAPEQITRRPKWDDISVTHMKNFIAQNFDKWIVKEW